MDINKDLIISKRDKIFEGVLKKALGFTISEKTEEYGMVDGELVLIKKKVNSKYFPPDLSAIEILLDNIKNTDETDDYKQMSIEELQEEKVRLMEELSKLKEK